MISLDSSLVSAGLESAIVIALASCIIHHANGQKKKKKLAYFILCESKCSALINGKTKTKANLRSEKSRHYIFQSVETLFVNPRTVPGAN